MAHRDAVSAVVNRLGQMRALWEDAAKEYFDPSRFLLHLQGCITVSRTVTFVLQKQKGVIEDFDQWYSPHQERLKADPVMKWAMEARNSIEKEGDLRALSQVKGEIIASYYEGPVSEWVPQALFVTPQQFYRAILERLRKIPHLVENGTLLIERRWIDEELPDREVLEALAHVYSQLAATVADFCSHLGFEPPKWISSPPNTMQELAMDRAVYVSMRDGSTTGYRLLAKKLDIDKKLLKKRYGDQRGRWRKINEAASFKELCEAHFAMARYLMVTDGYHKGFAFLFKGTVPVQIVATEHPDRATRYVLMRDLAHLARIEGADGFLMVAEVWTAKPDETPTGFAADSPNRSEALSLVGTNRKCESYSLMASITRKKQKKHKVKKLGATNFAASPTIWMLYPFQRMWGCVDEESMFEVDEELVAKGVVKDIYVPAKSLGDN